MIKFIDEDYHTGFSSNMSIDENEIRKQFKNIKPVALKWFLLPTKITYPILNYNLYNVKYKMYAEIDNKWNQVLDIESVEVR